MLTIKQKAFTVVELAIVIAVIGILASITTIGFRGMQQRAQATELKSDATKFAEQIEVAYIKNKAYPISVTNLGNSLGKNTGYTYQQTGQAFCLTIYSKIAGSGLPSYSVANDGKVIEGDCTAAGYVAGAGGGTPATPSAPGQPVASIGSVSPSSIVVNWVAGPGATSHTVRYGTSASPQTQASSCGATSCTINGLASNTTYYASVTATNAGGSTTSSVVSALTSIPAPTPSGITYTVSTVLMRDGFNYERYVITTTGGSCPIGTMQWKMVVSGGSNYPWSSQPWEPINPQTKDVPHNGFYSAFDVGIGARARCIIGTNASADSNTVGTSRGSGHSGM